MARRQRQEPLFSGVNLFGAPIVDEVEAARVTEAAVAVVTAKVDATPDDWPSYALSSLRRVALRRKMFTSDDVWEEIGAVSETYACAMGVVFRKAMKLGYIEKAGLFVESKRPSRHRSGVRVWTSLLRKD